MRDSEKRMRFSAEKEHLQFLEEYFSENLYYFPPVGEIVLMKRGHPAAETIFFLFGGINSSLFLTDYWNPEQIV